MDISSEWLIFSRLWYIKRLNHEYIINYDKYLDKNIFNIYNNLITNKSISINEENIFISSPLMFNFLISINDLLDVKEQYSRNLKLNNNLEVEEKELKDKFDSLLKFRNKLLNDRMISTTNIDNSKKGKRKK